MKGSNCLSTPSALQTPMPASLPLPSDTSAVQILDFLHELVLRFEPHRGGQIPRFHEQPRDLRIDSPVAPQTDEDGPF